MIKLAHLEYKDKEVKPVVDVIYEDMQRKIVEDYLPSGSKITENSLCDTYKVSRTPIREVLRRLESDGLIEIIQNRGAFVTGFTKNSFIDLLEERRYCEMLALNLSIRRIKKEDKALLDETFAFLSFYYAQRDIKKLVKIFKGFHQVIHYTTYNDRLRKELTFFYNCSERNGGLTRFYEKYLDEIVVYLGIIHSCYKDKNIDKAVNAMDKFMQMFIVHQSSSVF